MASDPAEPAPLQWSAQFDVAAPSKARQLPGDKLLLPPSALEQLLAAAPVVSAQSSSNQAHTSTFDPFNPHTFAAERHARELQYQDRVQQLPHPLTFRLVNPENGKAIYAGIREFSADDGEVVLSKFLRQSLGLEPEGGDDSNTSSGNPSDEDTAMANGVGEVAINGTERPRITVHAKQLPKGTFVKLRPLEAGYDPKDWKSLLEQHLRANFTTLTNGEMLVIPGGRGSGGKKEEFRFLVDGFKPEDDGICVVDTDLEVDIEALNEDQARETLKKIAAKAQRAPGTTGGSSAGGKLDLLKIEQGQVLDGEYVDYELPSWIRAQGIEIELSGVDEDEEVDLYTTVCPGKHILCQFCHLEVPQEGDPDEPNPEALLSGLTPHELADGGRTTECHLCNKIIRLRDMSTHMKHHEFEKLSRPAPRLCRNANCGRTLDGASKTGDTRAGTRMGQGPGNDIGLCSVCFGPLYVSMYDPEGKALRRRVERRYLTQLLSGCGKSWCRNEMCKTGRQNAGIEPAGLSSKEALPLIKPHLEKLQVIEGQVPETPLHFCTDESSQNRRGMAEMMAAEGDISGQGGYGLEWCVAAMEAEGGDPQKGREWLKGWAPQRGEAK
ncbi:hypothetical protein SLS56_003292 [Neofusicoccum ribis]|uniref:Ubiquitin-protein ligase E3A N-terminal zinc-binding domain-containing protein n=1 Tax=Neofusicoccum ribis TaxID=45134 RepID=A0ABR3SZQ0_9PEZI